jgi:hypothetical protein
MKFIAEIQYANTWDVWTKVNDTDPCNFVVLTVLEALAAMGHECTLLCATYDVSGRVTKRGVDFIGTKNGEALPSLTTDCLFFNTWPSALATCFDPNNACYLPIRAKKRVWWLHGDANLFGFFNYPQIIQQMDVILPMLQTNLEAVAKLCRRAQWIPSGINYTGIQPYCCPLKEFDVASSGIGNRKSQPLAEQVMREIVVQGGRFAGMMQGLSKTDLWHKLSRTRIFFYPSIWDGYSRLLSEAAALGCHVVVSKHCPSQAEHAQHLGGTLMDFKVAQRADGSFTTDADASRIACDLLALQPKPNPAFPSFLKAEHTVRVLTEVLLSVLSEDH